MKKRIQLPIALYELMVAYIQDHYDPEDEQRFKQIVAGLERMRDAEMRRNLYTAYKMEPDPETRELLRNSYLDKAGIPSHGRWGETAERKHMNGEFYD